MGERECDEDDDEITELTYEEAESNIEWPEAPKELLGNKQLRFLKKHLEIIKKKAGKSTASNIFLQKILLKEKIYICFLCLLTSHLRLMI